MAPFMGWAAESAVICASPYKHRISIHSDMGKIPAPGEWSDPDVSKRAADDTVLVIRARGSAGHKPEHVHALRSLGLKKICSYTYGRTSDQIFWGNVRSAKHMLVVVGRQHAPSGRTVAELGMLDMSVHEYGTDEEPGRILNFPSGEYIQMEAETGFRSFTWTSASSAQSFARAAIAQLGRPSTAEGLMAYIDDEANVEVLEGSSREIATLLAREPRVVTYVRIAIDGISLNWERPKPRDHQERQALATTSMFGKKLRQPAVLTMLARTASTSIAANREALVSKLLLGGLTERT